MEELNVTHNKSVGLVFLLISLNILMLLQQKINKLELCFPYFKRINIWNICQHFGKNRSENSELYC